MEYIHIKYMESNNKEINNFQLFRVDRIMAGVKN